MRVCARARGERGGGVLRFGYLRMTLEAGSREAIVKARVVLEQLTAVGGGLLLAGWWDAHSAEVGLGGDGGGGGSWGVR